MPPKLLYSMPLLYGSESWTMHASHEKKLNSFYMRCLRRIFHISWQDRVTNNEVLDRAKTTSLLTILRQRRLRWLGHVCRMEDGRIPKDLLYGELALGRRSVGRPHLRFKDVCKRDMKSMKIDTNKWEQLAGDRSQWKQAVTTGLRRSEEKLRQSAESKRTKRKEKQELPLSYSAFRCHLCDRDCHSCIGLSSHGRRCSDLQLHR